MNLANLIDRVIATYPEDLRADQRMDSPRALFHATLIRKLAGPNGRCMDVGGGIGMLSPLLAAGGIRQSLADDFGDPVNDVHPIASLGVHENFGVEVLNVDASSEAFIPPPNSFDVISTFDSIEHWHRSPKRSLHRMRDALKPDGALVIGLPNCVNLRKRISVPFGYGKWSSMNDWYEQPEFRGHVREVDVGDLRYFARDLGLVRTRIFGRNWLGLLHGKPVIRKTTAIIDRPLRLFPSLCSDLYLVGHRPT